MLIVVVKHPPWQKRKQSKKRERLIIEIKNKFCSFSLFFNYYFFIFVYIEIVYKLNAIYTYAHMYVHSLLYTNSKELHKHWTLTHTYVFMPKLKNFIGIIVVVVIFPGF